MYLELMKKKMEITILEEGCRTTMVGLLGACHAADSLGSSSASLCGQVSAHDREVEV